MRSVAQPMEEVFHLVAPKLALVLYLCLLSKIFYNKDRLIGDLGFFYPEFEEFFYRCMLPMEPDKFLRFALHNISPIRRSIPGKREYIVPFINFICEPLLQPGGSA